MATANRIPRARRALIPAVAVLCALCYATAALAAQDTRAIWSAAIVGPLSGPPAAVPRGVVRDVTRDITLPPAPTGARLLLAGGPTGAELIDSDDVLDISADAADGAHWSWHHDFGSPDGTRTIPHPPVPVPEISGPVHVRVMLTDRRPPLYGMTALYFVLLAPAPMPALAPPPAAALVSSPSPQTAASASAAPIATSPQTVASAPAPARRTSAAENAASGAPPAIVPGTLGDVRAGVSVARLALLGVAAFVAAAVLCWAGRRLSAALGAAMEWTLLR